MREKLLTLMLVPFLVLPILVIAAGGDIEILRREITGLWRGPIVVAVYAGESSPTVTATSTQSPSPGVTLTPVPGGPVAGAPLLSRWGMISASIALALVALWGLNRGGLRQRTGP